MCVCMCVCVCVCVCAGVCVCVCVCVYLFVSPARVQPVAYRLYKQPFTLLPIGHPLESKDLKEKSPYLVHTNL